jgi:hypothetical protein
MNIVNGGGARRCAACMLWFFVSVAWDHNACAVGGMLTKLQVGRAKSVRRKVIRYSLKNLLG